MSLPYYSFPSSWPDDQHAFCPPPCCGLLVFDANIGQLRCDYCGLTALDAAVPEKETNQ